jgi:hypothetical protein
MRQTPVHKTCARCNRDFVCLESSDCWCYQIDNRFDINPDIEDCLCQDCLLKMHQPPQSNAGCKKHNWIVGVIDPEDDLVLFECSQCHTQHKLRGIFK